MSDDRPHDLRFAEKTAAVGDVGAVGEEGAGNGDGAGAVGDMAEVFEQTKGKIFCRTPMSKSWGWIWVYVLAAAARGLLTALQIQRPLGRQQLTNMSFTEESIGICGIGFSLYQTSRSAAVHRGISTHGNSCTANASLSPLLCRSRLPLFLFYFLL